MLSMIMSPPPSGGCALSALYKKILLASMHTASSADSSMVYFGAISDGTTYGHENMIVMMMYRMKRTGRSSVYLDTGAKPGHAMLPDMGFHHPPSGEAPEKEKGNTTPPRSVGHKNWKTKEIYPPPHSVGHKIWKIKYISSIRFPSGRNIKTLCLLIFQYVMCSSRRLPTWVKSPPVYAHRDVSRPG